MLKAESDFHKTRKEYLEELAYNSLEELIGKKLWDLTRKKYAKDEQLPVSAGISFLSYI